METIHGNDPLRGSLALEGHIYGDDILKSKFVQRQSSRMMCS